MERDVNYIIKLKDEVTNEMLEAKGFKIEESKNFTWAIKEGDKRNTSLSEGRKTIIIKLSPPEREVVFRYQTDYINKDLRNELDFMKGFYIIKMR